ncbi:hypothetical protein QTV44_000751 [Vibrio vulnificus]|nr:hypothetical protein [Vibrio vulnificus]
MNILSIKHPVYDGAEQDFYSFRIDVKCPKCYSNLSFLVDDIIPIEGLNIGFFPKAFTKQLNLKRRSGGNVFENERGLVSYAMQCKCKSCGTKSAVIAGIGEIQPTRLNVVEGVVAEA